MNQAIILEKNPSDRATDEPQWSTSGQSASAPVNPAKTAVYCQSEWVTNSDHDAPTAAPTRQWVLPMHMSAHRREAVTVSGEFLLDPANRGLADARLGHHVGRRHGRVSLQQPLGPDARADGLAGLHLTVRLTVRLGVI